MPLIKVKLLLFKDDGKKGAKSNRIHHFDQSSE